MPKKLSRNCHDFILHCQQSPAITKEDKESCFDIFLIIAMFLANVVQFLRQEDDDFLELAYSRGENSTSRTRCIIIANICELILARQAGTIPHGLN
jgi:hypothetical protein